MKFEIYYPFLLINDMNCIATFFFTTNSLEIIWLFISIVELKKRITERRKGEENLENRGKGREWTREEDKSNSNVSSLFKASLHVYHINSSYFFQIFSTKEFRFVPFNRNNVKFRRNFASFKFLIIKKEENKWKWKWIYSSLKQKKKIL